MSKLNKRLRVLEIFFLLIMFVLTSYFVYSVAKFGKQWSNSAYNTRKQSNYDMVIQGSVYDRNGAVLAWSEKPNDRNYTEDTELRLSIAHLLGDRYGMTSGDIQQRYARVLYGDERGVLSRFIESVENDYLTGDSIVLTIDSELQKEAFAAMNGNNGAVVVMNYKTGEILSSASIPTFDCVTLQKDDVQQQPSGTFMNKVTRGLYPPGSIFKIVTATSLIENVPEYVELSYDCRGNNVLEEELISVNCFHGTVHGTVDLNGAFIRSCNGAFAQWSVEELGYRNLTRTAEDFGFNENFVFKDYTINNSVFDATPGIADLAWSGVGQGKTMITPLHAAMIVSAIANKGVMYEPRYLHAIERFEGSTEVIQPRICNTVMDEETADIVKDLMYNVVQNGTGSGIQIEGVHICGKTGTAEVNNEISHAWFVGFIDEESTPYAIAVILENSGTGASSAVPVARQILEKALELSNE